MGALKLMSRKYGSFSPALNIYVAEPVIPNGSGTDVVDSIQDVEFYYQQDGSGNPFTLAGAASGTNPVPNIVTRNVIDRLLGLEPIDWVARTKTQLQEAEARRNKQREERAAERKPNTTPSHPLAAYAGAYEHPGYGRLTVAVNGDALVVSFDGFSMPLKHFHYDMFEIDDPLNLVPVSGRVAFLMDKKGDVERLAVPFETSVKDIEFTRVKNP